MASPRLRILSPFPANRKNIVLTGKGVTQTVHNSEIFDKVPFEDPHALGIVAGYVEVCRGDDPANPLPELDLCGVYQSTGVVQKSGHNNNLLVIEKKEFVRNQYT